MTVADVQASETPGTPVVIVNDGDELVGVEALETHPDNPRRGDIDLIASSIRANGFYGRLVVQRSRRRICGGNHRYLAARQVGMTEVPVTWVDVDDRTAKRILLADNRTSDVATYDHDAHLRLLEEAQRDENLDGTGYDDAYIEALIAESRTADPAKDTNPDAVPDANHIDKVVAAHARTGDIWTVGNHRIICGDSRDPETFTRLMDGESADLVFTSPPYNMGVKYANKSRAGDLVGWDVYGALIESVIANCRDVLGAGRALCWNVPQSKQSMWWRQVELLVTSGLEYRRAMIWHKNVAGFPQWSLIDTPKVRDFRIDPLYEFVFVMSSGSLEHGPMTELDDTIRSDVFHVTASGHTRDLPLGDSLTGGAHPGKVRDGRPGQAHPATFPIKVPTPFVRNLAAPGEIVLDPFLGAGTTALAADREGRRGYGAEMTPRYVDLALWRLQRQLGELPTRDGVAHDFVLGEWEPPDDEPGED